MVPSVRHLKTTSLHKCSEHIWTQSFPFVGVAVMRMHFTEYDASFLIYASLCRYQRGETVECVLERARDNQKAQCIETKHKAPSATRERARDYNFILICRRALEWSERERCTTTLLCDSLLAHLGDTRAFAYLLNWFVCEWKWKHASSNISNQI